MTVAPPNSARPLVVGVSGHRKLGDPRVSLYVRVECVRVLRLLSDVAAAQGRGLVAWSALAIGADTLFAEAALGLGIPLVGVIPFTRYPEDFEGSDRVYFEALRGWCARVVALDAHERSDEAYLAVGYRVVDEADVLVAVWNGLPAAGLGGTGDVVAYARSRGREVIRIDPGQAPLPADPVPVAAEPEPEAPAPKKKPASPKKKK